MDMLGLQEGLSPKGASGPSPSALAGARCPCMGLDPGARDSGKTERLLIREHSPQTQDLTHGKDLERQSQ